MSTLRFQGRGNVYLTELDADLAQTHNTIVFCTDTLVVTPTVQTFSHINKCGAVDVEDARGIQSQSVAIQITCADVEDKKFAVGVFGIVNAAEASPSAVVAEVLPSAIIAGDFYFLGGKTRHRAVTAVVITDSASPAATLTANTNYTVDAASGLVTFVNVTGFTQPFLADYSHTDPASVSMMTGGQKEYFFNYELMNRQAANAPGSLELFRVRFDPSANLDFQSSELQSMDLKGSCLADTTRLSTDTVLGQFGRRVLSSS